MSLQPLFQKEADPVSCEPTVTLPEGDYNPVLLSFVFFFCWDERTFPSDTFQFIFNWQVVKVKSSESELQALNIQEYRPVLFLWFTKSQLSANRIPLPKEFSVFWSLQSAPWLLDTKLSHLHLVSYRLRLPNIFNYYKLLTITSIVPVACLALLLMYVQQIMSYKQCTLVLAGHCGSLPSPLSISHQAIRAKGAEGASEACAACVWQK